MKFILVGFPILVFVVSFFVAILADHPLISIAAIFAMILASAGIAQGTES